MNAKALTECLDRYWSIGAQVEDMAFDIGSPVVEMALLKRLGIPSFDGVRGASLQVQMTRVYDAVTRRALAAAFADAVGDYLAVQAETEIEDEQDTPSDE